MPTAATNLPDLTTSAHAAPAQQCNKCGEVKSLESFELANSRGTTGRRKTCRVCRSSKTGDQVKQIAARRRERKAQSRTPRQQAAEMTAQDLMWALDRIPSGDEFDEWREVLNKAVSHIRKSGRRTEDTATKALADAFALPYNRNGATAADLASDTGIPERDVLKILDGMISLGVVFKFPKEVPDIARGATIWLYATTGAKPRTAAVLP